MATLEIHRDPDPRQAWTAYLQAYLKLYMYVYIYSTYIYLSLTAPVYNPGNVHVCVYIYIYIYLLSRISIGAHTGLKCIAHAGRRALDSELPFAAHMSRGVHDWIFLPYVYMLEIVYMGDCQNCSPFLGP